MKVLYGITKSNFGGAQRYVFELASETKHLGHDAAVICGGNGILIEKLNKNGIRIISLNELERDIGMKKEISSFFRILKILRSERPDVFHVNSSKMGGLGSFAGRIAGIKNIIFTAHGWEFNAPRPGWQKNLIKFFSWLTILGAHKTICVSEKTRRNVLQFPFVKRRLVVIRNGIQNFELKSRQTARKELGIPENEFVVGATSELHKVKGLDVLFKSWKEFRNKYSGLLFLAGTGDELENLKNMAQNMDISDSVIFKGFVKDVRFFLSAFDIFAFPSRSEALPYAPLEAGVAGLPVVATAVGGVPEIIVSGINGILVPSEDWKAIFSSLILLRENPELRTRLGEELKKTVQEKFSKEKMIEKTFALYTNA